MASYQNFRFSTYDLLLIGKTPIPIVTPLVGVVRTDINSSFSQNIEYGFKQNVDSSGELGEPTVEQYVKSGNNQVAINFTLGTGGNGIANYTTPIVRALKGIVSLFSVARPQLYQNTKEKYLSSGTGDLSKIYKASYYSMSGVFIKDWDIISINESSNDDDSSILFNLILQESSKNNFDKIKSGEVSGTNTSLFKISSQPIFKAI